MTPSLYAVQILAPGLVPWSADALQQQVQERAPGATVQVDAQGTVQVAFPEGQVWAIQQGRVPDVALRAALSQSWAWPEAAEAVRDHQVVWWVRPLKDEATGPRMLDRLYVVLLAALETSPALAVHWMPAGKLVDPALLLDPAGHGTPQARHMHAVQVRFFPQAEGGPFMDTMGLAALGYADVVCDLQGRAPEQVAEVLYGLALHVLGNQEMPSQHLTLSTEVGSCQLSPSHARIGPPREVLSLRWV